MNATDHFSQWTDEISPFVALWPRIGTTAVLALRIRVTDRTCARVDSVVVRDSDDIAIDNRNGTRGDEPARGRAQQMHS